MTSNIYKQNGINPLTDKFFVQGKKSEDSNLQLFRNIIDPTLNKANSDYALLDYIGKDYMVELKTRNNTYNKYPTTIFGANKIEEGFKQIANGKRVIFAFSFTDGVYIWELTRQGYDDMNGDNMIEIAGTTNRGFNDYKQHFVLPIRYLSMIWKNPIERKNPSSISGKCFITLR